MNPQHSTYRNRSQLLASAAIFATLLLGAANAQHPANPSFTSPTNNDILTHNFGVFRQGASGSTLNFSVFNLPFPSGTTAPMTLASTPSLGNTSSIVLQTGTVAGIPAGSSVPMSLQFNTSTPGSISVAYTLQFSSDGMPSEPTQDLAIAAFATVYRRGDYDLDHDVDNADFALWRSSFGSNSSATDGSENGVVDAADYVIWRNNFTGPLGTGLGEQVVSLMPASLAVPEPTSAAILFIATGLLTCPHRRLRR